MAKISSISDKVAALFSAQAKAAAELRRDVDQLDLEIVILQNRLAEVHSAPVPRDEVERRIDAFLLSEETEARLAFVPEVIATPNGSAGRCGIGSVLASPRSAIGGLLLLGFRDQIRDCLIDEASTASPAKPLDEVTREREVTRITSELSKLERLRERIMREAEKAGIAMPRSEFADPAALLAADDQL